MTDKHIAKTVAAVSEALGRIGAVDPEDGCMAMFPQQSRRAYDPLRQIHYWTPAKHVAELLVNQLGAGFFTAREEGP